MIEFKIQGKNLEKLIAELYLYFMPFQMFLPFAFLNSVFLSLAKRASFLFLLLGLVFFLLSKRKLSIGSDKSSKLYKQFIIMYVVCDIASIFMAVILFKELGTIGGENSFDAVFPKIVYTFAYIVILFYNRELFRVLTKEEISIIFDRIVSICILIGYLQIAVLLIGNPFKSIYDFINSFFGAWSSNNIISTGRIALLTSEPAYISSFFGLILIPFILSKWIMGRFYLKDLVKLLLIISIVYFTKSTTGYSLIAVDLIVFGFLFIKNGNASVAIRIFVILLMIISISMIVLIIIADTTLSGTISGVFDKLFNSDNTTSMSRKVGLYVDWEIFKNYPIFGVGNGNQGFYYQKFFPSYAFNSIWSTQRYNEASTVLFDGGVFFGAFLSGYGILGLGFLVQFVRNSIKIMKENANVYGYLYYLYVIGGVALVVNGFSTTLLSDYAPWFLISLPMATYYWNSRKIE